MAVDSEFEPCRVAVLSEQYRTAYNGQDMPEIVVNFKKQSYGDKGVYKGAVGYFGEYGISRDGQVARV